MIEGSKRGTTKVKYNSITGKWKTHCANINCSEVATTTTYANFLAIEFNRGLKYSYIRSYNSALKPYIKNVDIDTLQQLLKGIFNVRPPKPKYSAIWDVNPVLAFLSSMIAKTSKDLTCKLAALLMLLSGNRANTLSHMKIVEGSMILTDTECTFIFDENLKHSRPNFRTDPLTFISYPHEPTLCPVKTIWAYMEMRGPLSDDPHLFITTVKPYRCPKPETISGWVKTLLGWAGVNTDLYTGHSVRAASTSAAAKGGVGIMTILKSASWSKVDTFKKYYFKQLEEVYDLEKPNFGSQLLETYSNKDM